MNSILNYFFPSSNASAINFDTFVKLFVYMTRGTVDEKASIMIQLASGAKGQITSEELIKVSDDVTITIMTQLKI